MTLQLPMWAQWVQWVATLLSPVVLAAFAAFIGWRQWRTAHERVVLDLFERRMQVYDDLRSIVAAVLSERRTTTEQIVKYLRARDRLAVLFGDEVVTYSETVREHLNRIGYCADMIDSAEGEERKALVRERGERVAKLSRFFEEFSKLIQPYVRMTQKL